MPTKTKTVPRRHPDPAGEAWQAEANGRWQRATNRARNAGGDFSAIEFFEAPVLPAFAAPAHVTRELYGRFLHDRDANVVHDAEHAHESCELDAIANATFLHFASELAGALPADVADCACMGGDA